MSTSAAFRWNFGKDEQAIRVYAEAVLRDIGRPGDPSWYVEVWLVRDEMRRMEPAALSERKRRKVIRDVLAKFPDAAPAELAREVSAALAYAEKDAGTVRLIDPAERVGKRVFVGGIRDYEPSMNFTIRDLAFMASAEAHRRAYPIILNVIKDHPEKVAEFGDEWLSKIMAGFTTKEENHA